MRVFEQDDAAEVGVPGKSTKDWAAIFGPDSDLRLQIEIRLGYGLDALRVEAFDRRDQAKGQFLIDRQAVAPT